MKKKRDERRKEFERRIVEEIARQEDVDVCRPPTEGEARVRGGVKPRTDPVTDW